MVGALGAFVSTVTVNAADAVVVPLDSGRDGEAVAAVRQRRRVIAPRSARVCRCRANLRRTVEYFHRAVRRRRAGQSQRVVIGDVVADHAAVGRECRDRVPWPVRVPPATGRWVDVGPGDHVDIV